MKPRHFIAKLDRQRLESAIGAAERKTSGEIRVLIHKQPVGDAVAFAQKEFLRLGMHKTATRNAVLLFVAPASQAFAIIGDQEVHAKCGQAFWTEVAAVMQKNFRDDDFTAALLEGIGRAGSLLAKHFPPGPGEANELPDKIVEA